MACHCNDCKGLKDHGVGTPVINAYDLDTLITEGQLKLPDMPVHSVWYDEVNDSVSSMFVDRIQEEDEYGRPFWTFKFKSTLQQKDFGISEDEKGCFAFWYEHVIGEKVSKVEADAAAGDTEITIADPESVGGFVEDLTIHIKTEAGLIESNIIGVSVNGKTLTLENALPADVAAGDCVERGVYNGSIDCDPIIKDSVKYKNAGEKMYKSYYRMLMKNITVETDCLINVPGLGDYLYGNGDPEFFAMSLAQEYRDQVSEMYREFINTFWFDDNDVHYTTDGNKYTTTMGGINAVYNVVDQDTGERVNVVNLAECCDETCGSMRGAIQALLDVVYDTQKIGHAYRDQEAIILVNAKQRRHIERMKPHFQAFGGEIVTVSRSEYEMLQSNEGIFDFNHNGITIKFQYERSLDKFPQPMMFLMPKGTVAVTGKKYHTVASFDSNGQPTMTQLKPVISGDEMGINIDVETKKYSKLSRCFTAVMFIEYAIVWMFVDKCIYKIIQGFEPCAEEICNVCDQTANPINPVVLK